MTHKNIGLCALTWFRTLTFAWLVVTAPMVTIAAETPPSGENVVLSDAPMDLVADDAGAHGQLFVPAQILGDGSDELEYTISEDPAHGQVGLAGADPDFFKNKSAATGYFAYRANDEYVGEDSFSYTVRNVTSGVTFRNRVRITVNPEAPVALENFEVTADREIPMNVREVTLTTRPNQPVTQKLPSHEDFMAPNDRATIVGAQVAYAIDEQDKPKHGKARLDAATGQLNYSPNPGFIGEDRFTYFTLDKNNAAYGVENVVRIVVEPVRTMKEMTADRSVSREVDLVFVINNSPSMADHQERIAANLRRFRQLFNERDLDYRIGVLTTDFVDAEAGAKPEDQRYYKRVRSIQFDKAGKPVLDRKGAPKRANKEVASNGLLVTLPVMPQPWVTPSTPDAVFEELVKVGTNGDSNRTAFTAVYNFVAGYYNKQHALLRPEATTIVVFFMDEEETRMAVWKDGEDGKRTAEWNEDGKLPELIAEFNERNPTARQTLDGYINYWVLRPFIIAKGNKRGKIEMHAVVAPGNLSHKRAAELTGGTVLNIESDFSTQLAELGDRIADTVAVALDPVPPGSTLYRPSIKVTVDGQDVAQDPKDGWVYDERSHSIRFNGAAKKKAFAAKIGITYEEHR